MDYGEAIGYRKFEAFLGESFGRHDLIKIESGGGTNGIDDVQHLKVKFPRDLHLDPIDIFPRR